ncbi:hypothetical protein JCM19239_7015 [Vibrio variabilis]|uniref:Uncharacterized protein n=1 Tax=Vibrio variabilis TaxID=990271 RepID=A0ABQ0JKC2_9VIBR|nr:hypothetical protein JCM19239_7015 [Vibrio variabilis]
MEQWVQQLSAKQTLEYKSSLELCLKELECFPGFRGHSPIHYFDAVRVGP